MRKHHRPSQDICASKKSQAGEESDRAVATMGSRETAPLSQGTESAFPISEYPVHARLGYGFSYDQQDSMVAADMMEGAYVLSPTQSDRDNTSTDIMADNEASKDGATATTASTTPTSTLAATNSLASMFEDFLDRRGDTNDGLKCGIIFLGESSPLTFALEELTKGNLTNLHDVGFHLARQSTSEEGIAGPEQNNHPSHLSRHDIAYLRSKGAFDFPRADILSALVDAFLTRFYPLYSIVNKAEFIRLYEQQKLPWILLHAVCFIGATFCDQSVIYRSDFKRRSQARQLFYDKAKVLFDVGYETNKIVLLQMVVMLTFWGPQMKNYWNPSSWVGFGVTIAESLGLHKSIGSTEMSRENKGLLRRLWWTLALRDATCAALLGRPSRINMAQCNTDMLTLEDFQLEASRPQTTHKTHADNEVEAIYQVQIAKLSLILRQIVKSRYGHNDDSTKAEDLHARLREWQSKLPEVVDWSKQSNTTSLFAIGLKIVFHHYLILVYLDKAGRSIVGSPQSYSIADTSSKVAKLAASAISSTALTLLTNSMISRMPHEIFPGYSIAGIVFYRHIQQREPMMAQFGRAALDNCQMVMNEARDHWDAASWMMRIFDFLLSSTNKPDQPLEYCEQDRDLVMPSNINGGAEHENARPPGTLAGTGDCILPPLNCDSTRFQDMNNPFDDFLLMPDFFPQ